MRLGLVDQPLPLELSGSACQGLIRLCANDHQDEIVDVARINEMLACLDKSR